MNSFIRSTAAILFAMGTVACSDSATDPDDETPRIESRNVGAAPTAPAGTVTMCYTDASGATTAATCPIIRWNNITYWAFEYIDGRNALNFVAYNEDQEIISQSERVGTRQLWQINVNANEQTVTLLGIGSSQIVIPWSQLTQE